MNKYKIVSIALSIALLAALVRLVYTTNVVPPVSAAGNAIFENILSRKSVRSYTPEPVSREQTDTLLRAAMAAPTGRDMRPWKFVVVTDTAVMRALSEQLPYAKMLAEARTAIIVCGDLDVTGKDGKPSTNWPFDCSAATENILLTAESMNLGAVWTGVYPYEERISAVKSVLGLPDNIVPFSLVPVGHPKGDTRAKDKFDTANIRYNGW